MRSAIFALILLVLTPLNLQAEIRFKTRPNVIYSFTKPAKSDDCYPRRSYYSSRPSYSHGGYNGHYAYSARNIINHGVRTGQLTRRELQDINRERQKLGYLEQLYRSDGRLSYIEARRLEKEAEQYRKGIYHNLNDGEKSYYPFRR